MSVTRRGFLRSLGALATVAAVKPKALFSSPAIESQEWAFEGPMGAPIQNLAPDVFVFTQAHLIEGIRQISGGWYEFTEDNTTMRYLVKVPIMAVETVREWIEYVRPAGTVFVVEEMKFWQEDDSEDSL